MLFEEPEQLVIDVADHVGEHVDPGAQEILRIRRGRRMHGHAHAMAVRLVHDGAIQVRRQGLDRAASSVHPDLDERHVPLRQLLHVGARALDGRHHVRGMAHVVRADFLERREASSGREEPGGIGIVSGAQLVPEPKRQLPEIAPHRLAGGDAEVGEPVHVVEDVLPGVVLRSAGQVLHVPDVGMRIDQGGNHRLAVQVHANGAGGRRHLALTTHSGEVTVLNEKGGALNRRRAIAGNQACPLVQHCSCGAGSLGGEARRHRRRDDNGEQHSWHSFTVESLQGPDGGRQRANPPERPCCV